MARHSKAGEDESVDLKYLEGVLRGRWENDISQVTSAELEPAVTAGDNYVSKLYRVKLTARTEDGGERTINIILKRKVDLKLKDREELKIKFDEAFNKEYQVYENILSRLERYLGQAKGPPKQLWPIFIEKIHSKDIYLEDLKDSGYRLPDQQDGMDKDHCHLVFRSLAEFHASSYLAVINGDVDLTPYQKYTITEISEDLRNAHTVLLEVLLGNWGPQWQGMAEKFERLGETINERIDVMKSFDKRRINVLNHGDPWVNNCMFQYDSNDKPVSIKFVDYQMVHYNSFAYDLSYFLNTSVDGDLKEKELDSWISTYCQTFGTTLERHGKSLPAPTIELVKQELERIASFSLEVAIRIRPVFMAPPEDSLPISEMFECEQLDPKMKKLYSNPKLVRTLMKDLPPLLAILN